MEVSLTEPLNLTQEQHVVEPEEVAHLINQHWLRYWNQEDDHHDGRWNDFLHLLDRFPPQEPVINSAGDIETWVWAIEHLNPTTARGICGWSASELQGLPRSCIVALKEVFDAILPTGMPAYLIRARVIALCKKPGSFHPSDVRPITILSLLYRVWSKTATRSIFLQWGDIFPPEITGFLPQRSFTTALYSLQLQLEQAVGKNAVLSLGGLTLDIQKAFNNIPREPCRKLLLALGIDPALVHCWYTSLQSMARSWQIQGQVFAMDPTVTGVPEGDQWSVIPGLVAK